MIKYHCDKCQEQMPKQHPDRQLMLGPKKETRDYCEGCWPDVRDYLTSQVKVGPLLGQQGAFADELARVSAEIRSEGNRRIEELVREVQGQAKVIEVRNHDLSRIAAERNDLEKERDSYKEQATSLQSDLSKLNAEFEAFKESHEDALFHDVPETLPPADGETSAPSGESPSP